MHVQRTARSRNYANPTTRVSAPASASRFSIASEFQPPSSIDGCFKIAAKPEPADGGVRINGSDAMLAWFGELNAKERRTMGACFGGWALDAFDVQMYSFVIPTVIVL